MRIIRKLGVGFVVALAVVALAAPAAFANLGRGGPQGSPWGRPIGVPGQASQMPRLASEATQVAPVGGSSGFDWADAGVGAGFAAGVVLLAAGLVLVLRRRHDRPATA